MDSSILTNALTTPVLSGSGVIANFHIIKNISIDDINSRMDFSISSYLDKDSYLSGMSILKNALYSTNPSDYQTILASDNFIVSVYSFLSSLSDFSNKGDE